MNDPTPKLKAAQIGKCGELIVQYQLLLLGIESAHLTTDSGIDLVAYSPRTERPITIQVKTNLQPKRGGGKGKEGLDWWVSDDCPAMLVAFVDLSSRRIWMMSMANVRKLAQQFSNDRHHFYMYVDPTAKASKTGKKSRCFEFDSHLLENCIHKLI